MNYLKQLLLAAFVLLTMSMSAATLDAPSAQARAYQFLASHSVAKLNAGNSTLSLSHVESSAVNSRCADYYVFNSTDGKAFVIVAGDDRAEEILGYGEGSIDMTDLPCNLQWWLDQYKEQIEFLIANPDEKVEKASAPRRDSDGQLVITPMLTCNWSQSEPYYNMCPLSNGERCVTGCVATAMAQVMYYWRYPDRTNGVSGYWCRSLGTMLSGLPATTFEWDDMLDSYAGKYTKAQGDAVAKLMRYCGQSCNMGYSPDGSGAYTSQQLSGMKKFGYSNNAKDVTRSSWWYENYTTAEWEALIKAELDARRPILYSANDINAGGHAFVCDGYDNTGMFHFNFGWYGTCDGWYTSSALNMTHRDGEELHFNYDHEMLTGVEPSSYCVIMADGLASPDNLLVLGEDMTVEAYQVNIHTTSATVKLVFDITDASGKVLANCQPFTINVADYEQDSNLDAVFTLPTTLGQGAYKVCFGYYPNGGRQPLQIDCGSLTLNVIGHLAKLNAPFTIDDATLSIDYLLDGTHPNLTIEDVVLFLDTMLAGE